MVGSAARSLHSKGTDQHNGQHAWQRTQTGGKCTTPIISGDNMQLEDIPEDYQWAKAGLLKGPSPVTTVQNKNTHFIIRNLWYNNGRFAALLHCCTLQLGIVPI